MGRLWGCCLLTVTGEILGAGPRSRLPAACSFRGPHPVVQGLILRVFSHCPQVVAHAPNRKTDTVTWKSQGLKVPDRQPASEKSTRGSFLLASCGWEVQVVFCRRPGWYWMGACSVSGVFICSMWGHKEVRGHFPSCPHLSSQCNSTWTR